MKMLGSSQVLSTCQCPLPQHLPAFLPQPWQKAIITAVTAELSATNGTTVQQSIACPELDFVPVKLWAMEDSTALGRISVAQHTEQPGPVPRLRVKYWSARLWLCVLVCDHGHFQKLERPNQGKRNIHLFCSARIHLLTCLLIFLFIHLVILY